MLSKKDLKYLPAFPSAGFTKEKAEKLTAFIKEQERLGLTRVVNKKERR